jgi:hypothetical protein
MIKRLLLLAALLLLTACGHAKDKDMKAMNPFANSMKTECVGRLLIDMPPGKGSWQQSYGLGAISKLDLGSPEALGALVATKRDSLIREKHEKADSMLAAYSEISPTAFAIVSYKGKYSTHAPDLDMYMWDGGHGYSSHVRSLGEDTLEYASRFFGVFNALSPRPDEGQPTANGFCIDSALLTGAPVGEYGTRADYGVTPKGWLGVELGILVEENQKDLGGSAYEALDSEERAANERKDATPALKQFEVLRKRERTIAGFAGQETASLTELANGAKLYSFRWRSLGETRSLTHPHITISLSTDNPRSDGSYGPTPPEAELFGLWDAVLDSLRWRQGALPQGAR